MPLHTLNIVTLLFNKRCNCRNSSFIIINPLSFKPYYHITVTTFSKLTLQVEFQSDNTMVLFIKTELPPTDSYRLSSKTISYY